MSDNTPNARGYVAITEDDLPLHCPLEQESIWDSHPRVYLPIENSKDLKIICPYCGTLYELIKK